MKIDFARVKKAAENIYLEGIPNTPNRKKLIEVAIGMIQKDPEGAFKTGYIGYKNYAHFGDQREDHKYGMGPKHGTIVFSIGRRCRDTQGPLGGDEIYFLECARDFEGVDLHDFDKNQDGRGLGKLNLFQVIKIVDQKAAPLLYYKNQIETIEVEPVFGDVAPEPPADSAPENEDDSSREDNIDGLGDQIGLGSEANAEAPGDKEAPPEEPPI